MPPRRFHRPRLLVVGANFAGIAAAQAVGPEIDVTVVDPGPWFEWLPNIHELVSRRRSPSSLRVDRRRLVRRAGHRFVRAEVRELDAASGRAVTDKGARLEFDACIVAVGGVHDDSGVRGAARHAMPFKSVADCDAIGRRLVTLARGDRPMRVAIVGAGIEGIECLGEVLRSWRSHPALRVHVIEGAARLFPEGPSAVDRAVRSHAAPYDVRFHTGARVAAVTAAGVRLDDGARIAADIVIWNGGSRPAPLLARAGLSDGRRQSAAVSATLQSRRFENVLVAGDAADFPRPLSKQAYFALQMGAHAGVNASRLLRGESARAFEPASKPMLLAFGDLDTFLVGERWVLAGAPFALAKEGVLQTTLATLDPPLTTRAALALGSRLFEGLRGLLPGDLDSVWRLVRAPGVRLLS